MIKSSCIVLFLFVDVILLFQVNCLKTIYLQNHVKISKTILHSVLESKVADIGSTFAENSFIASEISKIIKNDDGEEIKSSTKISKKQKQKRKTAREESGYNFDDGGKKYDVPIINEHRW